MKRGLSKFLQLKINIYICLVLGWWLAGFYVMMLGRFYFLINTLEREKIIQSIKTVFDAHQNRDEISQISQNVFTESSSIIMKRSIMPILLSKR